MSGPRWALIIPTFTVLALGGCGEGSVSEAGPRPWSLAPTLLEAGSGIPFCDQAMPRVAEFMNRFEGQMPPSEQYGGTASAGALAEIVDGMNAHVSNDVISQQSQKFVNLMTLVRYDSLLNATPYLAESWDDPGDGTITFHLRDDVPWHDGELTDAYDVAYTIERATDPETGFANPGWFTYAETGPSAVQVIDSFTVRVRFTPHADYMDVWTMLGIMPQHLLADVPSAELSSHPYGSTCPVGNGPFIFVQHRQDASWTFQANPAFPEGLGGRPHVDRFVYRVVTEQTTLLTELLTGNLDLYLQPTPDQVDAIVESDAVELRRYPSRAYMYVAWNSRRPQFADKRVRMAITKGLDREQIVAGLFREYAIVSQGTVPSYHPFYDPSLGVEEMAYDPDAARALLDEAGWSDRDGDGVRENPEGVRLSFAIKVHQNLSRQAIAVIMQAQLAEIGIEVTVTQLDWATLLDQVTNPVTRDFDAVFFAWENDFRLDDTPMFHSDYGDAPIALSGTHRSDIDEYLERLPLIVDRDEAKAAWTEYQKLLIDEQPFTFMYHPYQLDGVNKRIKGAAIGIRGQFFNLRDWWIPTDERRR